MKLLKIKEIELLEQAHPSITIAGWVRFKRDSKKFTFLEITDGSTVKGLQVIADETVPNYEEIKKLSTGSSLRIEGALCASPGKGQKWELHATFIHIYQIAPESYPLQKKAHSDEYLRTIAHLRPRTRKFGAIFRVRSILSMAIHQFFQEKGFYYVHTPILTASDCEGAGEMFHIATSSESDFFNAPVNLTVSGQLNAEMLAMGLGSVYTFGPTFRAENSNTRRHAAEFWMIEPEAAFYELSDIMALSEDFFHTMLSTAIKECVEDLSYLSQFTETNTSLLDKLNSLLHAPFTRLSYMDAITFLQQSNEPFDYPPLWGEDLQSSHEQYLTASFKGPVLVYDYPKAIKPFYMYVNDDDKTVRAMDLLIPEVGELIGGSQREDRFDVLLERMKEQGLPVSEYDWYLDSRRYGSVPHSGFGLGFERLLMYITGISNIRDVIPFPRTPGSIFF